MSKLVWLHGYTKEPQLLTLIEDDPDWWTFVDDDGQRLLVNKEGHRLSANSEY